MTSIPSDEERGLTSAPADDPSKRHGFSCVEAGRRGGAAVKAKYGKDFYREIGRKGGVATQEKHGRPHYEAIGKKGGAIVRAKQLAGDGLPVEHYKAIGKKGGAVVREVFARYRQEAEKE